VYADPTNQKSLIFIETVDAINLLKDQVASKENPCILRFDNSGKLTLTVELTKEEKYVNISGKNLIDKCLESLNKAGCSADPTATAAAAAAAAVAAHAAPPAAAKKKKKPMETDPEVRYLRFLQNTSKQLFSLYEQVLLDPDSENQLYEQILLDPNSKNELYGTLASPGGIYENTGSIA